MSEITESFDDLKSEAKDLGIDIGTVKSKKAVKELIDGYYASQSAGDLVEEIEEIEEIEEEAEEVQEDVVVPKKAVKKTKKGELPDFTGMTKSQIRSAQVKYHKEKKAEWMKTKIVTITNNDKRDNSVTTMCFLSAGVIQRQVPLDVPVELERCLIKVAQDITITNHVDEIVKGTRTGNKIPVVVKKYGISFADNGL